MNESFNFSEVLARPLTGSSMEAGLNSGVHGATTALLKPFRAVCTICCIHGVWRTARAAATTGSSHSWEKSRERGEGLGALRAVSRGSRGSMKEVAECV